MSEFKDHMDLEAPLINKMRVKPTLKDIGLLQKALNKELGLEVGEELVIATMSSQQTATALRLTGGLKTEAAVDLAQELIDDGAGKVLIGCWNHDCIDEITEKILNAKISCDRLTGNTHSPEVAAKWFMEFTEPCCLVMQVACGEGMNLQGCHHIIMVQPSYVPEQNRQFIGRCHRRGQYNRVIVHWLTVDDTIDDAIQTALIRKQKDIKEMMT